MGAAVHEANGGKYGLLEWNEQPRETHVYVRLRACTTPMSDTAMMRRERGGGATGGGGLRRKAAEERTGEAGLEREEGTGANPKGH